MMPLRYVRLETWWSSRQARVCAGTNRLANVPRRTLPLPLTAPSSKIGHDNCSIATIRAYAHAQQRAYRRKLCQPKERHARRGSAPRPLLRSPSEQLLLRSPAPIRIRTLCPSGLRGWTQVPLAQAAWVQIPQVSVLPRCLQPHHRKRLCRSGGEGATRNPATRNRTRDHMISARLYSQMLCQLSYSRLARDASAGVCFCRSRNDGGAALVSGTPSPGKSEGWLILGSTVSRCTGAKRSRADLNRDRWIQSPEC